MQDRQEESEEEIDFELEIDREEYLRVMRIMPLVGLDERNVSGYLLLESDGVTRRWAAVQARQFVVVDTGEDPRTFQVVVSPRLLYAWAGATGGTGRATLRVLHSGTDQWIEIDGQGGSFRIEYLELDWDELEVSVSNWPDVAEGDAVATAGADELIELMDVSRIGPYPQSDDDDPVLFLLEILPEGVHLDVAWPEFSRSEHRLAAATEETAVVPVAPDLLADLLRTFDDGEVRLVVPRDEFGVVRIEGDRQRASLSPASQRDLLRERVENCIESVFGPEVLQVDPDGDYQLSLYGVPVFARLIATDDLVVLRVFAVVLRDAPDTSELLTELNELNLGTSFARVVLTEGAVVAFGDLVADTLDDVELQSLYSNVAETASEIGPVLSARFGGTEVGRDEWFRWSSYLETKILAEVRPHEWVEVVGPDAVEGWDLPDEVFVVTGYNPFGRSRSREENSRALAELAGDLITSGGTAARALNSSLDDGDSEPSLLTWGLDERSVLQIARRYRQEAVFRLTRDTVEVVGALVDHRISRPRRGGSVFDRL